MCIGIEYFIDGERQTVYFDSKVPELPVLGHGAGLGFYRWGVRGPTYHLSDNTPGWLQKFPETGWAPLAEIRAGKWERYEPQPVRIIASRFIQVNSWLVPCYFSLEPGEFIQGLLATITHDHRVYVVTVPAPPQHAEEQWNSFRIVRAAGKSQNR